MDRDSNCTVDQRLCFRFIDNTITLLLKSKFQASSLLLYRLVCVGPGRKPKIIMLEGSNSQLSALIYNVADVMFKSNDTVFSHFRWYKR